VTGAGRGLAIATALATAGALVLANGRSPAGPERAVARITAAGDSAVACLFDIAEETAVGRAFHDIRTQYGRLDILVNNVWIRDRHLLFDFDLAAVRHLIEVDRIAPFQVSRDAQFIRICRWLKLFRKERLAPLSNAPFSTTWARKRCSVAQRFRQY
jgi:gluconate 5-dehydrogenase